MSRRSKRPRKPKDSATQIAAAPVVAHGRAVAVTVRHYCQGIGDCHLLSFPRQDGSLFRILIDCGIHPSVTGGSALIDDIVGDIRSETGSRIDILVITHEHWDHVSGFLTASEVFKDFVIDEIWMPWTENPDDPDAKELDKFKMQALSALQGAGRRLDAERGLTPHLATLRNGLQGVLGFQYGAKGERVRAARDAAIKLSSHQPPRYLEPGKAPVTIEGLPGVRIYVLGPPRNKAALKLEEKASEMYKLASLGGGPIVRALNAGLAAGDEDAGNCVDDASPFDSSAGTELAALLNGAAEGEVAEFLKAHYYGDVPSHESEPAPAQSRKSPDKNLTDQSWRRIDADWIAIAADLAMQLDRGVNNTSLVLAFEFIDSGRVFLFPGDAQVGSWLSWQDVTWPVDDASVKATDVLARTVYLKVAHHGSQNATLEKRGLEQMLSADLSAFVPTNQKDALKVRWGEMPYHAIMTALATKTNGRVVRADDEWMSKKGGKPDFAVPSGSILAIRGAARSIARGGGGLWVELDLA